MSDQTFERAVRDWLEDGSDRTPPSAIDAVLLAVRTTRQQRSLGVPPRLSKMPTLLRWAGAIALGAIVAYGAVALVGEAPSIGGWPTSSPLTSPSASPQSDPSGELQPGTYAAHPLPGAKASLTVTFTVPDGWSSFAGPGEPLWGLAPAGAPGTLAPGGTAIQFVDVETIHGDPCRWSSTAGDIRVGTRVDDLITALRSQTSYDVSDPVDVVIGGYSGVRVDVVVPSGPFTGRTSVAAACDSDVFRLWSTTSGGDEGLYAQGPRNRWQTNVLDVEGTRLVIVVQDFPGTSPADRRELDAVVDSIVIQP